MMTCALCRQKVPITRSLCESCKKIKAFVSIWGLDTILSWIYRYTNEAAVYGRQPPNEQPQTQLYPYKTL